MISGNVVLDIVLAAVLVSGLIGYFVLSRRHALRRVKVYTGGEVPETMDLGVIFYGFSSDKGRLKPRKGVIIATSDALVFICVELRPEIVEIPWKHLAGWLPVGEFRGRPLNNKILALRIIGDVGAPRDAGFAFPRPEFWTSLMNIAIKSEKKD
ncbi:MAG: hypothetical protein DRP70_06580 [Spirochaetes bacterium]|nr:MAG: hypothetical protein DRP60_10415 [Spirochaetota bacterium]RKX76493.1 MAG: hypothetical protein DRP49_03270 [Spirochaetota bacterium]RKX88471.1 MAG: hypothetical protein DRP70_06580 [Spirochaetota bacterium]RKX95893.1 MAG: hypothetical protein DRZ90_09620 [Spirochaetota bacterium]